MGLLPRLVTPATRRAVDPTGTKRAYAMPVVAASRRVTAAAAAVPLSLPRPPSTTVCTPAEAFQFVDCFSDADCRGACGGFCCVGPKCCDGCIAGACLCLLKSSFRRNYGPCTRDSQCCSGTCERSGAAAGVCACSPPGGPCLDYPPYAEHSADCCSGQCVRDPGSGGGICG